MRKQKEKELKTQQKGDKKKQRDTNPNFGVQRHDGIPSILAGYRVRSMNR
jgi:hypothetical protein